MMLNDPNLAVRNTFPLLKQIDLHSSCWGQHLAQSIDTSKASGKSRHFIYVELLLKLKRCVHSIWLKPNFIGYIRQIFVNAENVRLLEQISSSMWNCVKSKQYWRVILEMAHLLFGHPNNFCSLDMYYCQIKFHWASVLENGLDIMDFWVVNKNPFYMSNGVK